MRIEWPCLVVGFENSGSNPGRWKAAFLLSRGVPSKHALGNVADRTVPGGAVLSVLTGLGPGDLDEAVAALLDSDQAALAAWTLGPSLWLWARKLDPDEAQMWKARLDSARNRGHPWLQVQGQCMEPSIRQGDQVQVALGHPVRPGEVALVLDGQPWAHRLLAWIDLGGVRYGLQGGDGSGAALTLRTWILGPVSKVRPGGAAEGERRLARRPVSHSTVLTAAARFIAGRLAAKWKQMLNVRAP